MRVQSEIFRVANSLPHGLIDVIATGHTHGGLAHQVNGIGIIQPFSRGQSFGRVDLVIDRRTTASCGAQPFRFRNRCVEAAEVLWDQGRGRR